MNKLPLRTNVLVVGLGVVGIAQEYVLPHIFYKTEFLDPPKGFFPSPHFIPDVIFICVPTPPLEDGSCDDSIVLNVVRECVQYEKALLVIRSTVPPSTVDKLLEINKDIIFMPEFITAHNWQYDVMHPAMLPIGANCDTLVSRLISLLHNSTIDFLKVKRCTPHEASLIKYIANSFLASKITFMHEMERWISTSNFQAKWESIKNILVMDSRIGDSHLDSPGRDGYGFAGACFPKDVDALIQESGSKLSLLKCINEANTQLRKTNGA